MKKHLLLVFALIAGLCVSAFAVEEPDKSTTQKVVVQSQEQPVTEQAEQKVFSEEEILTAAYANNFETLCFLYKKPGHCAACDRARADLRRLEDDGYPVTYVYCDDPDNEELYELWEVDKVPSFVTVRHLKNGEAEEYSRFTSSVNLYRRISYLYKDKLDFDPTKPHRPRVGILPPPRPFPKPEPKPRWGDKPRPGDPKPEPKPHWYAPWTWF